MAVDPPEDLDKRRLNKRPSSMKKHVIASCRRPGCFRRVSVRFVCLLLLSIAATGCGGTKPEVVVYAALDREFSEPAFDTYAAASGVKVLGKYDIESTKTTGLVNAIINEGGRPRCDVFWNNEILHTIRLQKRGLLQAYQSPQAEHFPASYRSSTGHWYGLAARARVLLVNTDKAPAGKRPASILALADPQWKGRCGIAKPLYGTTATHAAVLFATWGEAKATAFFQKVQANAEVMSGNKTVAQAVASGELHFGLTDTDDAIIEVERGAPVAMVFPDQQNGQAGALRIPTTLCILKGAPHLQQAQQLVDHLLQPAVEQRLNSGPSAQMPLHQASKTRGRVLPEQEIRWMEVDFEKAADAWDTAYPAMQKIFEAAP